MCLKVRERNCKAPKDFQDVQKKKELAKKVKKVCFPHTLWQNNQKCLAYRISADIDYYLYILHHAPEIRSIEC